jgi:hypothetical protein
VEWYQHQPQLKQWSKHLYCTHMHSNFLGWLIEEEEDDDDDDDDIRITGALAPTVTLLQWDSVSRTVLSMAMPRET